MLFLITQCELKHDCPCVSKGLPASLRSKYSLMDGGRFEPRCTTKANCSYLLMCLKNNILHLALSRRQAVWPGGDVLNGILIIEIFAALCDAFLLTDLLGRWSLLLMCNWRTGGGGMGWGLCKNLILLCGHVLRFYKTYRIHQHLIPPAHYLYESSMFSPCIKRLIFQTYSTTDKCGPLWFPPTLYIRPITRSLQHK